VAHASGILKIDPLLDRRPGQLSGGQRQRVAIGRAIVREPDVFLFDEPLSNLDAELRVSMRIEIARLHRQLGNTMIYVTHDQTEAMTLADKIVVLRDGRVEQVGTPRKVYEDPDNVFVAGFIGSPRMNLLQATKDGDGTIKLAGATLSGLPIDAPLAAGDGLIFGMRPEHIELSAGGDGSFGARVDFAEYLGSTQFLYCTLDDGQSLIVERREGDDVDNGSRIQLTTSRGRRRFFRESGERLR
jgi:lactose/L-arabinose transport system ATP-binding protein